MKVPKTKNGESSISAEGNESNLSDEGGPSRRTRRRSARLRAQRIPRAQRSDSSEGEPDRLSLSMWPVYAEFRHQGGPSTSNELNSTSSATVHDNVPRPAGTRSHAGDRNRRALRVIREVQHLQNSTQLLPRLPFAEIVGEVLSNFTNLEFIQASALDTVHDASEAYLRGTLEDAMLRGLHKN